MLRLVVRERAYECLHDGETEVVLRDNEERAYGHTWTTSGAHWIAIDGVAKFQITPGSDDVVAFPDTGAARSAVEHVFYASVLPIALRAVRRFQSLHASAVVFNPYGGIVAFAAVSETGKSTVAAELSARGHPVWADDAVAFDVHQDHQSVSCIALPFALRVRASGSSPPPRGASLPAYHPYAGQTRPLATVCLLERKGRDEGGDSVEVMTLPPADALTAVMPQAYFFGLRDLVQRRQMVEDYLALVSRVPVLRIRFETDLGRLPDLIDTIEGSLREAFSSQLHAARTGTPL